MLVASLVYTQLLLYHVIAGFIIQGVWCPNQSTNILGLLEEHLPLVSPDSPYYAPNLYWGCVAHLNVQYIPIHSG